MASRKIVFAPGEYYHIFNRGVARQPTFLSKRDYEQALLSLSYYRFTKPVVKLSRYKELSLSLKAQQMTAMEAGGDVLVDIVSFVCMPNHFHMLLRQRSEHGISRYVSQFSNSFTRYFNTKRKRPGPVFQGVFKAVHIETDEQLLHVSRYIHLNPVTSFMIDAKELMAYPWSSLPAYIKQTVTYIDSQPVLSHFSSPDKYMKFVFDQEDYQKTLEEIKHLRLDES